MGILFKKKKPTNEELIKLVQKETGKLGRTPLVREFEYASLARSRFGSWSNFLAAAGLELSEYSVRGKKISYEELIDLVQEQAAELGRVPQLDEFEYGRLAKNRYGSWKNFLVHADLEPESAEAEKDDISNEKLMKLVKKRMEELGYEPTEKEFKYSQLAIKRYGTWTDFLECAGVKQQAAADQAQPTNEELLELVKKRTKELGQVPQPTDFEQHQLAVERYGDWKKFLNRAGLESSASVRITNEELIHLVQKQAKNLEEPPKLVDFPHKKAVYSRFGGWNNFLEAAGIKSRLRERLSSEELIDLVQKQAEESGKTPTAIDFPRAQDAVKQFGSWNNFLKSAGLRKEISDEELIALVQQRASDLGYAPTLKEFEYTWLATRRFGTWKKFLQKAGLEVKTKNMISNERLIELVREQALEIGHSPSYKEFEYSYLAASRYGTWNEFLQRAGLEIPNKKRISNKELIKSAQQLAEELGRRPRMKEFEHGPLVKKRFGTWKAFLQKAGLGPNQAPPQESFRSWLGKEWSQHSKDK